MEAYRTGNVQRNDNNLPPEPPLYWDFKIDFQVNTLPEAPKQAGGCKYSGALINQMYLSKRCTEIPKNIYDLAEVSLPPFSVIKQRKIADGHTE